MAPLYLALRDKSELTRCGRKGVAKFGCYYRPTSSPSDIGHFYAVFVEGYVAHVRIMGDCMERRMRMRAIVFAQNTLTLVAYVFASSDLSPSADISSWFYAPNGGGAGRKIDGARGRNMRRIHR